MAILKDTLIQGACRVIGDAYMSLVTASGFKKDGSSDSFVLLGGGSHKAVSDFVLITSSNRLGVYRLYRRDDNSNYSVQTDWTGTYWRLRGYSADTYHAGCLVAYADSAGSAGSATSATSAASATIATSLKYIESVSNLDSGCTLNGIYSHANTATSSPSNTLYGNLLNISNKDTCSPGTSGHWIQLLDFTHEGSIWHRQRINTGNWTTWEKILTTTNWTGIIDGRYLLLSGGTMTGALTVPSISVTGAATFNLAINGSILGNAATASRLQNNRTITIGNLSNSFDGSGNISYSLSSMGAFASSSFTLANIKSTLGISDWALAESRPSYAFSEITGTVSNSLLATAYLPLTGGTILASSGTSHSPLVILSKGGSSINADWVSIDFKRSNGTRLGYLGIKSDIGAYYYDNDYRTIIHSGNISSQSVASADKLSAQRTISLTGAVTGSGTFDGSGDLSINTSANNITADTITVNTPATTDDSLYNIVFHSGNSLYTSPAKVGRKTGKITCGNISCGSLTASSTISLANNTSLGFKDTTDTYRNCLTLNTSNGFAIGYGTSGAGYNTYLDGKNIYFRTNTNHTTALTLSSGQTATFAGKVELKSDQYTDNGTTCGLDAKNSNIVGINALYFADYCNSATEGINFKRSSGDNVDTLYCQDGVLKFMYNRQLNTTNGTDSTLITSDNISNYRIAHNISRLNTANGGHSNSSISLSSNKCNGYWIGEFEYSGLIIQSRSNNTNYPITNTGGADMIILDVNEPVLILLSTNKSIGTTIDLYVCNDIELNFKVFASYNSHTKTIKFLSSDAYNEYTSSNYEQQVLLWANTSNNAQIPPGLSSKPQIKYILHNWSDTKGLIKIMYPNSTEVYIFRIQV